MTCTVAAIIYFLNYMPPKGTVIYIPPEKAERYTPSQQRSAKRCARRYEIELRIGNG